MPRTLRRSTRFLFRTAKSSISVRASCWIDANSRLIKLTSPPALSTTIPAQFNQRRQGTDPYRAFAFSGSKWPCLLPTELLPVLIIDGLKNDPQEIGSDNHENSLH